MILNMKPLNLAEVKELVDELDENKELKDYLKKFGKLNKEKSEKLEEELKKLENMKLKEEHLIKIADFLPRDAESLNKIFTDVTLDEKETKEILEIAGRY